MPAPDRSTRPRNPYLNRVMIRNAADFYGRRREVAKIFARIGAARPQSVAIVGERRIGKSSLLHHLCHPEIRRQHLDDPESYTFVPIDLQEQREIGIPAFFESVFRGIEHALGQARPPNLPADYEGARRALLRLQEEGRKIILLFDEFDVITRNPNFPEEFFSFLRAVANKYDVAYVTTSGRDLQQLCHTDRIADSPFFNIFSNLFLTRFEPEEALALIQQPSQAAGVPLAPYATDIIDLAGLFPFFVQMACSAFFEQLAEGSGLDLGRVRAGFVEEAEPHFRYIYDHFDEDQRLVLGDLADDRPVPTSHSYLRSKLKRDGYLLEQNGRERLFSSVFVACMREGHPTPEPRPAPSATKPLGYEGEVRSVIEAPALEMPAKGLAENRDASLVGRQMGAYQILSRLGAGGMGEVYRARDTKLGRDVAVKVLPASFAHDPDRLARFKREAQLLAALNHPHIAAIYSFEEAGGVPSLVLELVEGPTLAQVISREAALGSRLSAALSVSETLTIARQIADALEAAHQKGIIHRDLKPANIILQGAPGPTSMPSKTSSTARGDPTPARFGSQALAPSVDSPPRVSDDINVKVLDFGLAKAFAGDGSGPDLSQLPTVTAGATREGLIMGTPAYMSPEQSRGKPIDKRTDIWAFGCVLYELLTGCAAFAGETLSDTIAAVLEREPDWKLLPATTPSGVERLLQRCLQKDPKHRLHDIADARIELDEALTTGRATSLITWVWRAFSRSSRPTRSRP